MAGELEKVKSIFIEKLNTMKKIESLLKLGMNSNRDVSWGVSVVEEVGVHFDKLRALDKRQNEIHWMKSARNDIEILELANKLQGTMNNVKNLMAIFSMKIKGGQEIVKSELKELVKAKKINGYKSMLA